jgi:cyclic peptide transporter
MFKIFKIFKEKARFFYVLLVLLGVINSVLYSSILICINSAINRRPLPFLPELDWAVYVSLVLAALLVSKFFQTYIVKLTLDVQYDFELSILRKLLKASYEAFNRTGAEKIYTAISDTRILSQVPESFINILNASIIVVCGVGYLFWISPTGGTAILLVMLMLLAFYLIRNRGIEKDLNRLRDLHNDYHRYVMDLLDGFREVRMSTIRSKNIFDRFLNENRRNCKTIDKETSVRYLNNELTGNFSWYIIIGLTLFVLPRITGMELVQVTSFILTILYIMGPVATLITFIPFYTRIKIAVSRVFELDSELDITHQHHTYDNDNSSVSTYTEPFQNVKFNKVTYKYFDEQKREEFTIGPLDLEINAGEVVFVTGGNGSGKSTFINLLTGICRPTSGDIFLNDIRITGENAAYYRNQVSAIFTNNHLFSENYDDFPITSDNELLLQHVEWMMLSDVVKIDDHKKTISTKLSKGQQKRLALIYSLFENKQLVVLDEWAAEQDPEFRRFFYHDVVSKLKENGKTVVAVTHDDHYFDTADRVLKFDYGRVVSDKRYFTKAILATH